ncbi:TDT family transporter [Enterococcus gallinarum]|uniref:TDT family transporter n=1 Tax=Enterococcus gallinarum TaxID=1353 RepID=UPI001AD74559|nr:TDT family transporter [Enterococcus gallinarum]MBO6332983.1 TDT family transporter [Enterococcus gallinarum]MBO6353567.1 TDT family transporter [Enterococcus gallinarum]MBO6395940.1 TDT family transporter [Enterococcus gallinarum]MBO6426519.1 TDT family transporter [Enterococcus gallinarum]MDV7743387.1 TDT family transporter [Enterococcus gallinarum]
MNQALKNFLNAIPIPICGLILGTVSLGNLLFAEGFEAIGNIFCLIGILIMGLFLLKLFFTFKHTLADLKNPIIASVAPTFTMSLMVISVVLERVFPNLLMNDLLWLTSIGLHLGLMTYFVVVHILPVDITLEYVYPSWFITFVGIGVIPNTSAVFIKELGEIVVWIALVLYFALLPVILKRIIFQKMTEASAVPLITILTAPGSLCLAGYLSVFKEGSALFVALMLVLSQAIYFCVVFYMKKMLEVGFYPSYAAFTFPLVISATAMFKSSQFFIDRPILFGTTELLSIIETVLAIAMVCYVLLKYFVHLYRQTRHLVAHQEF